MNLSQPTRLQSIDLLRGAIMILMVIDHTRCYTGIPAGGTEPAIFFTRWITHYCAPTFAFFAGSSAFLYGQKQKNKSILSRFLLTRGVLLVILELTLVRLGWAFHIDYASFIFMGILWMLGWCMIIMAGLIWLKPLAVGATGLAIILFQQVFDLVPQLFPVSIRPGFTRVWNFVYSTGWDWPHPFAILYVIVPWIGVMAAGYGFGLILQMDAARRRRICIWVGWSAIAIFLIGASVLIALEPADTNKEPFIFRLLNQRKYPASVWYLLMTLGPVIVLLPFAERAKGWLAKLLCTLGSVPLFYYLLHLPVIYLSAQLVNYIRNGFISTEWYKNAPFANVPPEYTWSLWLLYLVIILEIIILYFASRWYSRYKAAHREKKWLKYL